MLNVDYGLCDVVEGTVELKKDTIVKICDIQSAIDKIKRKKFNTIEVSKEEVQSIKKTNPFLPESYITFLNEVGFADLDWIDVGRNMNSPTNLNDDEIQYINEILANYKDINLDDLYFIAVDSGDTYYALSKVADEKKVYILSNDSFNMGTYETFEEFLIAILTVN